MTTDVERAATEPAGDPTTGLTEQLARFVAGSGQLEIAPEVSDAARRAMLDWFGVALAGSKESPGRILAELGAELGGHPQATLVADLGRTSVVQAALINGTAGHALDYDDTHLGSAIHTTATVLPAVLALAEWQTRSGRDLLRAYVVGFEVATYLGQLLWESHLAAPWHATAMFGTIGAAAAGSVLLDLDERQTAMALGIASTQAAGLRRNFGSMSKPLHAGKAASNGVLAALLAERGFTSGADPLEGRHGFVELLGGHLPPERRVRSVKPLGQPFRLLSNDLKLYACCHATHASVDTAVNLQRGHRLSPDAIERVEVRCSPVTFTVAGKVNPATGLDGKFSVGYAVAVALADGFAGVEQFTDERVREPVVRDLYQRVTTEGEPGFSVTDAAITVRLRSGEELTGQTSAPRGSSGNPASFEEIAGKYRSLAARALPAEQIARLESLVARVDELADAGELTRAAVSR